MNEYSRRRQVEALLGPIATCPWCGRDPQNPNRWNRRGVFRSGSREARRALRQGRAVVVRGHRFAFKNQRVDKVLCAHLCHHGH